MALSFSAFFSQSHAQHAAPAQALAQQPTCKNEQYQAKPNLLLLVQLQSEPN